MSSIVLFRKFTLVFGIRKTLKNSSAISRKNCLKRPAKNFDRSNSASQLIEKTYPEKPRKKLRLDDRFGTESEPNFRLVFAGNSS
jgi:hypothetical protein